MSEAALNVHQIAGDASPAVFSRVAVYGVPQHHITTSVLMTWR